MATPAHHVNDQEVLVSIKLDADGNIAVHPERFKIHKHQDQFVRWHCPTGEYFTVEFEKDSPFYESQFSRNFPCSGLVRRPILPDKLRPYKYTIRVGNHVLDPEGEVDN
jgi:hypothetical protein